MAKKTMPVEKLKASKTKPVPVRIVGDAASPMESSNKEMRNYRAEDALRDIQRAQKHERDKELMRDVKKLAKEQVNSLKKLC
jgi:hypothetical protein